MTSILENLYHGNIGFDARDFGPDSPFAKAAHRKRDSIEKLMDKLNDHEKELFEQYLDAQCDMEDMSRYETYTETLKFSIRLMAELYSP